MFPVSWRQALYAASRGESSGQQQVSQLAVEETTLPPAPDSIRETYDADEEDEDNTPLGLRRVSPPKKGVVRSGVSLIVGFSSIHPVVKLA